MSNTYSRIDDPLFDLEVTKVPEVRASEPSFEEWTICFRSRSTGETL